MDNLPGKLWEERWRLGAWVGPALILVLFAHRAVLPLAKKLGESRFQLATMRENIYEPAWLDSTQAGLRKEVALLEDFHDGRKASLNRDASVQGAVDRIRALAQKSGIEVVKTTPTLVKQDSLKVLKVKIEGFTPYSGLTAFFDSLQTGHPDLYLEEMLVRKGGERSQGRMESHLLLYVYGEKSGGDL
jgi:hypothetical protein